MKWLARGGALALGGALVLTAVPSAQSAHLANTFTCSATAVRVGTLALGTANIAADQACADADGDVLGATTPITLPANLGTVDALFARTDAGTGTAHSEAGVLMATINLPANLGPLTAEVLTSEADATCAAGQPVLTGDSTIAAIDGPIIDRIEPLNPPNNATADALPEVTVNGVGALYLSYQTVENGVLTQRAVFFDSFINPVPDIVIAEAVVDRHGNPCGGATTTGGNTTSNTTTGSTTGETTTGSTTTGSTTTGSTTTGSTTTGSTTTGSTTGETTTGSTTTGSTTTGSTTTGSTTTGSTTGSTTKCPPQSPAGGGPTPDCGDGTPRPPCPQGETECSTTTGSTTTGSTTGSTTKCPPQSPAGGGPTPDCGEGTPRPPCPGDQDDEATECTTTGGGSTTGSTTGDTDGCPDESPAGSGPRPDCGYGEPRLPCPRDKTSCSRPPTET